MEDVGPEGLPAVGYGSWRREVGGVVETEEERAEGRRRERARAGR